MSGICGKPIRVIGTSLDGRQAIVMLPCTKRTGHQLSVSMSGRAYDHSRTSPHEFRQQEEPEGPSHQRTLG